MISWQCGSSGHRACLLLWQSEFEYHWSLQFYVYNTYNLNKKENRQIFKKQTNYQTRISLPSKDRIHFWGAENIKQLSLPISDEIKKFETQQIVPLKIKLKSLVALKRPLWPLCFCLRPTAEQTYLVVNWVVVVLLLLVIFAFSTVFFTNCRWLDFNSGPERVALPTVPKPLVACFKFGYRLKLV